MQTSPVQSSQANAASSSSSNLKSQGAPDTAFSQMLTQQIADRNNIGNNTNDAVKPADTTQASETSKADNSAQAGNSATDAAAKQADPANASDAKTADSDKTKGKDDASKTDANAQATPVSAELMALVHNHLNQLNAKAADPNATGAALKTDTSTSPLAAQNLLQAQGKNIAANENAAQALAGDGSATDTANTASAKAEGSFAAALSAVDGKTDDPKQLAQLATDKLQDGLTALSNGTTPQLQQAALNLTQTVAPQAADKLMPPVGTPAWDQALGQKVVWMVAGEQQSASLTLNPPDLGPLHVVLHVSNGQADASFTANQPEVRQALEAAMPKLREMMSQSGIQLGQASISAGMPNQQSRSGEQSSSQNSRGSFSQSNDAIEAVPRITGATKVIGGQGMVDTFV